MNKTTPTPASGTRMLQSAVLAGINDDRKALLWKPYKSYAAIEWTPTECVIRDAIIAALKTPRLKRLAKIAAMGMTPENMADAIEWALGMGKDGFAPRQEGQGIYWWRTELRNRALGLSPKNSKKAGRKL
jgi:hypothetical protein